MAEARAAAIAVYTTSVTGLNYVGKNENRFPPKLQGSGSHRNLLSSIEGMRGESGLSNWAVAGKNNRMEQIARGGSPWATVSAIVSVM